LIEAIAPHGFAGRAKRPAGLDYSTLLLAPGERLASASWV
jgi:hypothetical protein